MKRLGLVILGVFCTSMVIAQSVQQGQVLEYQGSQAKTPLSKVVIAAGNAAAVTSDDQGQFSLSFRTLHAGDAIQFRRVELGGYEVMNQEAIENARVARKSPSGGDLEGLTIVMIRKEALRQLRDGYRSVAAQRYQKQLQATEEQLEQMRTAGKIAEEQYNARMDSLEADYEDKLSKLETYIDKFARIDLSDLDADEQKIISYVQAGDFDEALKIYESQNLAERLKKSREDQAQLVAARDKLAEAAAQKAKERERIMASIDRQITLLLMAGGEENQMKVLKIQHEVFLADQTDVEARKNYATAIMNYEGNTQKAIDLLLEGVKISSNDIEKGQLLVNVAFYSTVLGNDEAVVDYAMQADSLLWPNRGKDHKVVSRYLPMLTHFYLQKIPFVGDVSVLPAYIQRLKEHWNPDYSNKFSLSNHIDVLNSLTEYDTESENHEQALWDVHEAIRLDSCMANVCPYMSMPYLVNSAATTVFAFEGKFDELKDAAYKTTASILESYPKVKSTQTAITLAMSAFTVMEALVGAECYETADSIAKQIAELGLMKQVLTKYPGTIDGWVGLYWVYFGQASATLGRIDETKSFIEQGLELMAKDDSTSPFLPYIAPSSKAKFEEASGNYKQAESLNQEAITALKEIDDEQPNNYYKDAICHYYLGVADLYLAQSDTKQAKKYLKQAEKYASFELDKILIEKRNNKTIKR